MLQLKNISEKTIDLKYDSKIFSVAPGQVIDIVKIQPGSELKPLVQVQVAEKFEQANPGKFKRLHVIFEPKTVEESEPVAEKPAPKAAGKQEEKKETSVTDIKKGKTKSKE